MFSHSRQQQRRGRKNTRTNTGRRLLGEGCLEACLRSGAGLHTQNLPVSKRCVSQNRPRTQEPSGAMPVWQTSERGQRSELSIFAFVVIVVVVVIVSCTIFHAFKSLLLPRLVRLDSYYSTTLFRFYKHAVASNRQSNSRG